MAGGEGSRGGKVVGHTRSGKPIYGGGTDSAGTKAGGSASKLTQARLAAARYPTASNLKAVRAAAHATAVAGHEHNGPHARAAVAPKGPSMLGLASRASAASDTAKRTGSSDDHHRAEQAHKEAASRASALGDKEAADHHTSQAAIHRHAKFGVSGANL